MVNRVLTIHVASLHWLSVRKGVHDQSEQCPHEKHNVREEADGSQPKWTMFDVRATTDKKTDDRNRVAEIQKDDTCRDHAIQCQHTYNVKWYLGTYEAKAVSEAR
jgi:hypothetical protein